MKRTLLFSVVLFGSGIAFVWSWQDRQIAKLEEEVDVRRKAGERVWRDEKKRISFSSRSIGSEGRSLPDLEELRAAFSAGSDADEAFPSEAMGKVLSMVKSCSVNEILSLAQELISTQQGRIDQKIWLLLLGVVSHDDPEAALDQFDQHLEFFHVGWGTRGVIISELAKVDPQQAMARAKVDEKHLKSSPSFNMLWMHKAAQGMMGKDPELAIDWLLSDQSLQGMTTLTSTMMKMVGDSNSRQVIMNAINGLESGPQRGALIDGLIESQEYYGSGEELREILGSIENIDEHEITEVLDSVGGLVSLDPDVVTGLIGELSPSGARSQNLAEAMGEWVTSDYISAAEWLDRQEASADREVLVEAFVRKVAPAAPELARSWMHKIEDTELRAKLRRVVVLQEAGSF